MRWRGVHHLEINIPDYENTLPFYDRMFGWLGYSSFWTLGLEYMSTYYVALPHSYIGIQPARTKTPYRFEDWNPGLNHIALHAKNRKEIDRFHENFLSKEGVVVLDAPCEYPLYAPAYYAVFFLDPVGIKWELAHFPLIPSPWAFWKWYRLLKEEKSRHPEWKRHPMREAVRPLPRPGA